MQSDGDKDWQGSTHRRGLTPEGTKADIEKSYKNTTGKWQPGTGTKELAKYLRVRQVQKSHLNGKNKTQALKVPKHWDPDHRY